MHATLAPVHRAALRARTPATPRRPATPRAAPRPRPTMPRAAPASLDVALLNAQEAVARADFLEAQARRVIRAAVAAAKNPVFPCAFIAGDVVLLHLLATEGLLANDRVPVVAIDTFHLFDETHDFCRRLEQAYDFTARVFRPAGFNTKAEFVAVHGSDLFLRDTAEYDRIAKVEPFQRAMRELNVDLMINGRRRDHGGERAFLEVAEAGNPLNVQPLAYWEFADCMRYIEDKNLEAHPLHAQGYPSIGDVHSTLPVPRDKWFEYGGERSGRFQNLTNADGSPKTECGIHNRPK